MEGASLDGARYYHWRRVELLDQPLLAEFSLWCQQERSQNPGVWPGHSSLVRNIRCAHPPKTRRIRRSDASFANGVTRKSSRIAAPAAQAKQPTSLGAPRTSVHGPKMAFCDVLLCTRGCWGNGPLPAYQPQNRHPERSASQIDCVTQCYGAESKDLGGPDFSHAARCFSTHRSPTAGSAVIRT